MAPEYGRGGDFQGPVEPAFDGLSSTDDHKILCCGAENVFSESAGPEVHRKIL
jgi:hypothetical protein